MVSRSNLKRVFTAVSAALTLVPSGAGPLPRIQPSLLVKPPSQDIPHKEYTSPWRVHHSPPSTFLKNEDWLGVWLKFIFFTTHCSPGICAPPPTHTRWRERPSLGLEHLLLQLLDTLLYKQTLIYLTHAPLMALWAI